VPHVTGVGLVQQPRARADRNADGLAGEPGPNGDLLVGDQLIQAAAPRQPAAGVRPRRLDERLRRVPFATSKLQLQVTVSKLPQLRSEDGEATGTVDSHQPIPRSRFHASMLDTAADTRPSRSDGTASNTPSTCDRNSSRPAPSRINT
jgi:hypothetical protein